MSHFHFLYLVGRKHSQKKKKKGTVIPPWTVALLPPPKKKKKRILIQNYILPRHSEQSKPIRNRCEDWRGCKSSCDVSLSPPPDSERCITIQIMDIAWRSNMQTCAMRVSMCFPIQSFRTAWAMFPDDFQFKNAFSTKKDVSPFKKALFWYFQSKITAFPTKSNILTHFQPKNSKNELFQRLLGHFWHRLISPFKKPQFEKGSKVGF